MIIDSHAHIFPDRLDQLAQWLPQAARTQGLPPIERLRNLARSWLQPLTGTLHETQSYLRYLPESARKGLDELSGVLPLPNLLVESTAKDLKARMHEAEVDRVMIIAHPPYIPNELILETCQDDPSFIPVVKPDLRNARLGAQLKSMVKKGAKALKIHPASDGEGPESPRYHTLLKTASELGLPVIVHTGCLHLRLVYKEPEHGHAQIFEPWFREYPEVRFILAHMNFHEPDVAMDIACSHPNVWLETSWQPAETIGEAVRRIGPDRVLFGTDWPIVGNNLSIGLRRVRECTQIGMITPQDEEKILGLNAAKLFEVN